MAFRWVWGTYVLSVAWVGLILFHVHRHFDQGRKDTFRQEGRRLVGLWAEQISGAGDERRQERVLRRLSGEMDSRSVSLLDVEGKVRLTVGDPSPAPPRLPFSKPSDRPLPGEGWAYWAPLWIEGRRAGYLAWVRDSSALKKQRAHSQRGLLAAGAWWAALGAVGAGFATRSPLPRS
jgi:hypothetical protein